MMRRNWVSLLLLVLMVSTVGLPMVIAGDDTLFTDLGTPLASFEPGTQQAKRVAINWDVLKNGRSQNITINLFDGRQITASRDRLDPSTAANGYVWVGHVQGEPHSALTLSVVDGVLVGSIMLDGNEQYSIKYNEGAQILRQVNSSALTAVEGADTVEISIPPESPSSEAALCEDGSRIDILVAYTAAARIQEGGSAAIEAMINQRISDMNTANSHSGLAFTYNLVHVMQTNYAETGNVQTDLPRLRSTTDGYLDDVAAARETHLADMVSLLIAQSTVNNSCGIGYVMGYLSTSFGDSAVNVAALDYIGPQYYCSDLTLAHEFGHNMGNLHNRENNTLNPILPYAYGYRPASNNFRTIMSYNCPGGCPQINYWSDPGITYAGEAVGIDHNSNPGSSADNARSMAQTAFYIANFRENCGAQPTDTPVPTHTPTTIPPATATATKSPTMTPTPTVTSSPTATPRTPFVPKHRFYIALAFTR